MADGFWMAFALGALSMGVLSVGAVYARHYYRTYVKERHW